MPLHASMSGKFAAIAAVLALICLLPGPAHAGRQMLQAPQGEAPAGSPKGAGCTFSIYGEVVTVDAAPTDLQTYVISATSPQARDDLAQALASKIPSDSYQLVRKMTTLPYLTVKLNRQGMQEMCRGSGMTSLITDIEADQAVMTA